MKLFHLSIQCDTAESIFHAKEFHAFETPYSHILFALSGEIALYSMSSVVYLLTYYAREQ